MKIKDIAAICKKKKILHLYEDRENQYASDGGALYKLIGLPHLTGDELLTLFDVPEKQRDKWYTTQVETLPIDLSDYSDGEVQLEKAYPLIKMGDALVLPLEAPNGVILMNSAYLKPVSDDMEYQTLWYRSCESAHYIVVKNGMTALAAILPMKLPSKDFLRLLYDLADGLDQAAAAQAAKDAYAAQAVKEINEFVDKTTGEVRERHGDV